MKTSQPVAQTAVQLTLENIMASVKQALAANAKKASPCVAVRIVALDYPDVKGSVIAEAAQGVLPLSRHTVQLQVSRARNMQA